MPAFRALFAVLLAASACSPVEPIIDGPMAGLEVIGTVRTADGTPVAGATLDVRARTATTCTGVVDQGLVTSTAMGTFSRTLLNWGDPMDVCVWIAVVPPAGSGVAADTVTVQPARLQRLPASLSVDIVLGAQP